MNIPPIWRIMRRLNPFAVRNFRRGIGPPSLSLILTTTGRKSGLLRQTPLQYELWNGLYYVGSARGVQADWFRNLQANPRVQVEIDGVHSTAVAQPITDPEHLAKFFAYRLQRHPWMIGILMRLEGLPLRYNQNDLERFAIGKAAAAIRLNSTQEQSAE